jgi:hypothetical protein
LLGEWSISILKHGLSEVHHQSRKEAVMSHKKEVQLHLCQHDCMKAVGTQPQLKVSKAFINFLAQLLKIGRKNDSSGWVGILPGGITIRVRGDRSHQKASVTIRGSSDSPNVQFDLPRCMGTSLRSLGETLADGKSVTLQGGCVYALIDLRAALQRDYPDLLAGLDNGEILLQE